MKRISMMALAMSLAACGGSSTDSGQLTGGASTGAGTTQLLQTVTTGTPPGTDEAVAGVAFLAAAYQDGLAEVRISELAAQRAANSSVKEYALAMIEQHIIANGEIQRLAQQKNLALPTDVSTEQAAVVTRLSGLTGEEFDRNYMRYNVEAHGADLAAAMSQARDNTDVDTRFFAAITVPLLKTHLAFAEDILNRLDPAAFVSSIYQSSLAEVAWARIALERATNADVQRFAQQMVDDHTAANSRITMFAANKGLTLPDTLMPEQQAIADDLARFSGTDFDRAYMDANVVGHATAVRFARVQQSSAGRDVDVRGLAASLEPDLAGHLLRASELARQIKPSFLYTAAQSNWAELRFGYLGMFKATDAGVKAFAQRMVTEHTAAQLQIEQVANTQGVTLPIQMSPEQALAYAALAAASSRAFDAGYAAYNFRLHDRAVERFTQETQTAASAETRALAEALLPALNAHLDESRALLKSLGSGILALLQQLQALRNAQM